MKRTMEQVNNRPRLLVLCLREPNGSRLREQLKGDPRLSHRIQQYLTIPQLDLTEFGSDESYRGTGQ